MQNFIQALESAPFLSGTPIAAPSHWTPDAAITADLKVIAADQKTLLAALKADGPTIAADQKALAAAFKTARAAVPTALTTKLKTDTTTLQTDITTLWKAIKSDAPAATITADKAAVKTATGLVQADDKAIDNSIDTNAGVVSAQAKLKTDSATIVADGQALEAAYKKLATDLKNHA